MSQNTTDLTPDQARDRDGMTRLLMMAVALVDEPSLQGISLDDQRVLVVSTYPQDITLPCRRGCYGCCRGSVAVTPEEAERIVAAAPDAAFDRALANADGLLSESRDTWCPLLDPQTKACTVYDERPLVCRAYHNVGDPDLCYPDRVGPALVPSAAEPQALALAFLVIDAQTNGDGFPLGAVMVRAARNRTDR